jgi:hypothetical protein
MMNGKILKSGIKCLIVLCLLILLVVGDTNRGAIRMGESDLIRWGSGWTFWRDACTLDGFLSGGSAVFCATGSLASCFAAASGLVKAWKVDRCFD